MKDSKEHSQKIRLLHRSLKRGRSQYYRTHKIAVQLAVAAGQKPEKVIYDEPADALVYAIISENITQHQAHSAIHRIKEHFVDLNDLRVSREDEIAEVLGGDMPAAGQTASAITKILAAVFGKYNMVSLKPLRKIGKRPAKQFLEKMDGVTHFAVNYCMLTSLQGHAIPLTERMIEYLKNNGMVHPDSSVQETEGFLARQISAEDAYEFYTMLRHRSETAKGEAKGKKKAVHKTKEKIES